MKTNKALLPILAGFFVMSFCDIIGTVMNQVKAECGLSDVVAGFLPAMIFMWFFFISLPTGVLCGKIGRKNAVLVSGDLANAGLETELAAVAETWFSVFPDGKLPDGSPVANLMHYGDHDAEARFYNDKLKAKLAAGGEIRFVVRPANCWGVAGRPCSSVWNGSRVSLNALVEERRVG